MSDLIFGKPSKYSLHVELTSRCILECPACPRTIWKDLVKSPVAKADLDLAAFVDFVDCEGGRELKRFTCCGDYGDPIYYPYLFEFIEKFRDSKRFIIHTNGSKKPKDFWHRLASLMHKDDYMVFAIDGLEDTNHIYRINADWPSIMTGLDIMAASPATVKWKTIVFDYNYKQLPEIKKFAESKGAVFQAERTHRYGKDSLKPPEQYIETNFLYQPEYSNPDNRLLIAPQCNTGRTITSDGYLFPCDWIRNPRTLYKSDLWKQHSRWLEKLNIRNTNYDEATKVVADWANFVRENSVQGHVVPDLCKMKCREGCVANTVIEEI